MATPKVIYYIDVDNSNQSIRDWSKKLGELDGNIGAYVIFVMNQCAMNFKMGTECNNLQDELLRRSFDQTNTATIVTPAFKGEGNAL